MGYLKVIKNKAYFKKFQTPFKRRMEAKTDYHARQKMILQDKDKFRTPKYRLIVRFTNKHVIAQIAYSEIVGDHIICSANSSELPKYGIKLGLKNYAAAYATGLLLARRVLTQLKMEKFEGLNDAAKIGEDFTQEEVEERRPFKVILDVGLARTTTGSKIFAVMKGVCDGGVYVPHSPKRFVGANEDGVDAEVLRHRLLGGHVADYMKQLSMDDPESYKRQFSLYIKEGIKPEDLENIYIEAHKKIRENPVHEKVGKTHEEYKAEFAKKRLPKLSLEERKKLHAEKLAKLGLNKKKI